MKNDLVENVTSSVTRDAYRYRSWNCSRIQSISAGRVEKVMSTFTVMGREYNTDEWIRDVINLVQDLAKKAKLEEPLPPNTDLTDNEQKEIQEQVRIS